MQITRLKVENFRSISSLDLELNPTTVLIGQNNAGKTAIVDAIRIALTRRWGQRGTGFTEHDVHRDKDGGDPRLLPPVRIVLTFEEPAVGAWNTDMVAALEDIAAVLPDGRNAVILEVTCVWSEEKEAFDPAWRFLAADMTPMTGRAQRATNLTGFFGYAPLFWLGPLRDASDEFTPRSGHWGRLLKGVRIPAKLEEEVLQSLALLDEKIVAADPRLSDIANRIGDATHVAIAQGQGAAKLNTLPMAIEDMLLRTGIVLRNEEGRPWLPLANHGQGLQSLAVIFLFQAANLQQLAEEERPGMEAIFAIEEPEAHLHPQAARTLWEKVTALTGQRILTTHSPYFVQHVPLRDLRLVQLNNGCTVIRSIPPRIISDLPWNDSLDGIAVGKAEKIIEKDTPSGCIAVKRWVPPNLIERIKNCYKSDPHAADRFQKVDELHNACRLLPSNEDEEELGFHGRRVRGEIFFARRWILVEGVTEYLLLHSLSRALGWPFDTFGVAVIDFQQSGNAGIYPALGDALGIPWHMVTDGDDEGKKFEKQILDRGF